MSKAAHYREEAARARRWAADTADPEFRRQLLNIAESYEKLATKVDVQEAKEKPRR
jgi:hypothetical protein